MRYSRVRSVSEGFKHDNSHDGDFTLLGALMPIMPFGTRDQSHHLESNPNPNPPSSQPCPTQRARLFLLRVKKCKAHLASETPLLWMYSRRSVGCTRLYIISSVTLSSALPTGFRTCGQGGVRVRVRVDTWVRQGA